MCKSLTKLFDSVEEANKYLNKDALFKRAKKDAEEALKHFVGDDSTY